MHGQRQALIVVLNLYKKGSIPRTNTVTLIEALFSQKEKGSAVMGFLDGYREREKKLAPDAQDDVL